MSDNTPREYTAEETRDKFLKHVHALVDYWENESRAPTSRAKLSGLAFSIMSALDGGTLGLPGFIVVTNPCDSDKEYHRDNGENWFPAGADLGVLHEFYHQAGK